MSKLSMISVALMALLMGCESTGLSSREATNGWTPNYTTYVYAINPVPGDGTEPEAIPTAHRKMALPARIAVAQIGEVAPPASMLDQMRNSPSIAAAQPVPGTFQEGNVSGYAKDRPNTSTVQDEARFQIQQMCQFARSQGMDHLFLFGGTVDYGTSSNGLSVLDLTIVGAFVVPSKETLARGKAAGTLIDLATNRVVLSVTSEAERTHLSSSVSQDGEEQKTLHKLREELIAKLATELVEQIKLQ